jgi:hypothetical protein
MPKLDLYRKHRGEYVTPRTPVLVTIKPAKYLAIAGRSSPSHEGFNRAIGALYSLAFTIKMARKFAGRDYVVTKLEGLWWGERRGRLLIDEPESRWRWKLMIRVPPFINEGERRKALQLLRSRGKDPLVAQVKLETLREGRCVQVLHVGPYTAEHESIARMMTLAREQGRRYRGRHHEIYLSDPRRVPAARLKTILRHPLT